MQDYAHTCFPHHLGKNAQELHAFFTTTFCAASQCNWRAREKILKPLAEDKHSSDILWSLLVWAAIVALVLGYALLLCHWNSRVSSTSNSFMKAVQRQKWKADKLY